MKEAKFYVPVELHSKASFFNARIFMLVFLYFDFRLFTLTQSYIALFLFFNSEFYYYFPLWIFLQYITVQRPTSHPSPQARNVVRPKAEAHRPMEEEGEGGEDAPQRPHPDSAHTLLKLVSTIPGVW